MEKRQLNQEKGRDVYDIIDTMLKIIPKSETKLIDDLTIYKSSMWNKAPEVRMAKDCWLPLTSIMNHNVKEIDTEWKIGLLKIFNNP
jgi:hypothetical protein